MSNPHVEIHGDVAWLVCPDHVHEMDATDAWNLGDDLLIASGTLWQAGTGQPDHPGFAQQPGLTDQDFLDERALAILFTDDQLNELRELAQRNNRTLPQLVREEILGTLEFVKWDQKLYHPDLTEMEQAPEGDRPTPPPGGVIV